MKAYGLGNLTKDPEVRVSADGSSTIARYSLACNRGKNKNGEDLGADFISCIAFGKNAEFAEKYLKKGMKIFIEGHIQTGSYEKQDGTKVYTTDVVVDRHEFCTSRDNASAPANNTQADDFSNIPDDIGSDLPFA